MRNISLFLGLSLSLFSAVLAQDDLFNWTGDNEAVYAPGNEVKLGAGMTLRDVAAEANINPAILARFNGVSEDAGEGTLVRIPSTKQINGLAKEMKVAAAAPAIEEGDGNLPLEIEQREVAAESSEEAASGRQVGRMPFHREDYTMARYEVTKADAAKGLKLSDIGRKFHQSSPLRMYWFNNSKSDRKVRAGEIILVPDNSYTFERFLNRLPFGNRNTDALWPLLPPFQKYPSLIEELKSKISSGDFETESIRSGQRYWFWVSGEYHVLLNGVSAITADTFLVAKVYTLDWPEGGVLKIADKDVCHNWCGWLVQDEPVPPVEEPPQVLAPPLPPDTIPWDWDTTTIRTDLPIPGPSSPPSKKGLAQRAKLNIWAGHDFPMVRHVPESFFDHGANFAGSKFDYFFKRGDFFGQHSLGLTAQLDGWDGESRSGFRYAGFETGIGILPIFSFGPVSFSVYPMYGIQYNWGWASTAGWKYDALQFNQWLKVGETFDFVGENIQLSHWGNYKIDLDGKKTSSVNGRQQTLSEDPPNNCGGVDGGIRLYFLRGKPVEPLIVWRESYSNDDYAVRSTIGVGIRCWKERLTIEFPCLKNTDRSKYGRESNGWALEALIGLELPGSNWWE